MKLNSAKISEAQMKVTENFSVSPTDSCLCGVVVKTPDQCSRSQQVLTCNAGFFYLFGEKA